jgi:peroxiredoxin
MNVFRKSGFFVIAVLMFTIFSCADNTPPAEAGGRVAIGVAAPDFVLTGIDGAQVRLSDFKGKVVLLNFWATWCPPCRAEIPSIESLNNKMKGKNLVILAVSIDGVQTERLKNFTESNHMSFTILHDPGQEVADIYLVSGIPTTYLIDTNGIIVDKAVGSESWDSPERINQIQSLMK